jgi:uncharacterized protein YqjF (DUF2071 family)
LELDTYDGSAWIGVVPFRMTDVGPRGLGWIPGLSAFAELNVRTYVRAGGRSGVWFFSLDAASRGAVEIARARFYLPYLHARMSCRRDADGWVEYMSTRRDARGRAAEYRARYRPVGEVALAKSGSLESWLTERYCLFSASHDARLFACDIHHRRWPLRAAEAVVETNTMAAAAGIELPDHAPLLHFVDELDVVAWSLMRDA